MLNIKMIYWDAQLSGVSFNNVLAILTIILMGSLPIYLIVFYTLKLKQWNDEDFEAKYGSLIEGTNRKFKSK